MIYKDIALSLLITGTSMTCLAQFKKTKPKKPSNTNQN